MKHWRRRLLTVPIGIALLVLGIAVSVPNSAQAVTAGQCASRVNNTPAKLLPCIRTDELWNYMKAFQAIADANPGPDGHPSRNSGEPGYLASVRYVAKKMQQAGYKTTIQTYKFEYSSFVGTPTLSETAPTAQDFALG